MADALLQRQKEGRYDGAARAGRLAEMLAEDARTISNDKHVRVEARNPMVQDSTDPVNLPAASSTAAGPSAKPTPDLDAHHPSDSMQHELGDTPSATADSNPASRRITVPRFPVPPGLGRA